MRAIVKTVLAGLTAIGVAGTANAAEIKVMADIGASTTWTANNTYNLQKQIYVLPGVTLTIEAGTVIASDTGIGGSLAITKGAKIMACGDKHNPIIFTSKADVATWTADPGHPTGGDPSTGMWREGAEEWGNLTLMGAAFISENATPGNTATCNAANTGTMEGLPADSKAVYGGGNDDDDSGVIKYVSLRYGGKVVSVNVELNGLSLGGIGRDTDINHVDIMNNIDDGIEIWGGTVYLKYINIWNIGDDSFDIDQGWRGCAQFILIVQGYSVDKPQGGGVGDNCFETDGAEDSDYQPVTTGVIYNATVVGQPLDGDHGTAWRDNARIQYRNCIFTDLGDEAVRFDNVDGDGANGYGFNGTLSWASTWTTDWNAVPAHANDCNPRSTFYKAQTSGKLAEIKDTVFYHNSSPNAYTEAINRGVFAAGNNNVLEPLNSPITSIMRGPTVTKGTKLMQPVIFLDPRPANDALMAVNFCPSNPITGDFFCAVKYRGAFAPNMNWLCGWTACEAFNFTPTDCCGWCETKPGVYGVNGAPLLSGLGPLTPGSHWGLHLDKAKPSTLCFLIVGFSELNLPYLCGCIGPAFNIILKLPTSAAGTLYLDNLNWNLPAGFCIWFQYIVPDASGPCPFAFSNTVKATGQP